jgi:hypothetical protein
MPISARLIANRAGFKFKNAEITAMCAKLQQVLDDREKEK